jgi:hypothetical protein
MELSGPRVLGKLTQNVQERKDVMTTAAGEMVDLECEQGAKDAGARGSERWQVGPTHLHVHTISVIFCYLKLRSYTFHSSFEPCRRPKYPYFLYAVETSKILQFSLTLFTNIGYYDHRRRWQEWSTQL